MCEPQYCDNKNFLYKSIELGLRNESDADKYGTIISSPILRRGVLRE
jgi:hypothetical protein